MVGPTAAQAAINFRHKDGSKCRPRPGAAGGADAWVKAQTYIRPFTTGPL
jgi:hypothetical protein